MVDLLEKLALIIGQKINQAVQLAFGQHVNHLLQNPLRTSIYRQPIVHDGGQRVAAGRVSPESGFSLPSEENFFWEQRPSENVLIW